MEVSGSVSGHGLRAEETISRFIQQPSVSAVDTGTQLLLAAMWREASQRGHTPSFADVAFSNFSQTEEDGIIWLLVSLLGARTRRIVEFGAGDGTECNAANLILNHGWDAFLVDGDAANVELGRSFLSTRSIRRILPPHFVQSWVTRENVNALLADNGVTGQVDILSIDLDGIDYWVWDAIDVIDPAIVIMEFNASWLADASVTVPYRADFAAQWIELDRIDPRTGTPPIVSYHGASLPALVRLGRRKGYRLIGTNALGFNAFFVKAELRPELFPEVAAEDCFDHPPAWLHHLTEGQELLKQFAWESV